MFTIYVSPVTHAFTLTVVEDEHGRILELRRGGAFGDVACPQQGEASAVHQSLVSQGWERILVKS